MHMAQCFIRLNCFVLIVEPSNKQRDLLTQIAWNKKWLLILETPEHVDSENIKLKIGCGSFLYQLFSKRDFYFIKCG
jgi:hypothetical protein